MPKYTVLVKNTEYDFYEVDAVDAGDAMRNYFEGDCVDTDWARCDSEVIKISIEGKLVWSKERDHELPNCELNIINKLKVLREAARRDCGSYIQELIDDLADTILAERKCEDEAPSGNS